MNWNELERTINFFVKGKPQLCAFHFELSATFEGALSVDRTI